MTLPRFNGYPVRGFLRAPASVAAANVVVLFHPTIEEEGTTPLDAATRFMNMATDSSKLNIAGTNIIFACELTRAITNTSSIHFIFTFHSIAQLSISLVHAREAIHVPVPYLPYTPSLRLQAPTPKTPFQAGLHSRRKRCSPPYTPKNNTPLFY